MREREDRFHTIRNASHVFEFAAAGFTPAIFAFEFGFEL